MTPAWWRNWSDALYIKCPGRDIAGSSPAQAAKLNDKFKMQKRVI